MPRAKISEFSTTPGDNTDIDGINIGEGCAPSGINDAIRELMAQLKDFQSGAAGDNITVVGTLAAKGTSASGADLKLYEDTDNGTNYVGFIAPASIASNVQWTLPSADGTNGQALVTNGSGVLSFTTIAATPGGSNTQVQFNNSGAFGGSANMTFNGTRLTVADLADSSLTSGRVTYATTGGNLTDSANFTFDGSNLQIGSQGDLRLGDADNSNWVAFQAPATVTSNVTWTLPSADGTNGQALTTNGSGTLSFTTISASPGGSNGQVQYNSSGTFAGSSNFNYDGSRLLLGLSSNLSGARLQVQGATDTAFTALTVNASTNDAYMGIGYSSSGGVWQIFPTYNATAGYKPLAFVLSGSEAARFTTSGTFQCVNSISVGNATPTTSGAGITFPATQSASTDANTLDDYEEGTWTPTDASGAGLTFNTVYARYTKIGNTVVIRFFLFFPSTANGNAIKIGGMPFTGGGGYSSCPAAFNTDSGLTGIVKFSPENGQITITNQSNTDYANSSMSGKFVNAAITYII